jgi:hypothetical protein
VREYALQKLELVRDRIVSHKPQDSVEHELVRRAVTDGQSASILSDSKKRVRETRPPAFRTVCIRAPADGI